MISIIIDTALFATAVAAVSGLIFMAFGHAADRREEENPTWTIIDREFIDFEEGYAE